MYTVLIGVAETVRERGIRRFDRMRGGERARGHCSRQQAAGSSRVRDLAREGGQG